MQLSRSTISTCDTKYDKDVRVQLLTDSNLLALLFTKGKFLQPSEWGNWTSLSRLFLIKCFRHGHNRFWVCLIGGCPLPRSSAWSEVASFYFVIQMNLFVSRLLAFNQTTCRFASLKHGLHLLNTICARFWRVERVFKMENFSILKL